MKKKRILAGIALTAGLGLTGVATAPVSGAATPQAPGRSAQAQPAKAAPDHKGGHGPIVCIVKTGGPGGKDGGTPGLPPLPGKPGKGEKTTVKVVNGKVYINGKPAPKGSVDTKGGACPLPPKGGKGLVIVEHGTGSKGAPGGGAGEAGLTTSGASDSAVLG